MKNVKLANCFLVVCVMSIPNTSSADTFGNGANQFSIEFVPISGTSNPTYGIPAGTEFTFMGVSYDYRIGTYEITNDQWNKFKDNLSPVIITGSPLEAYDQNPYWTNTNVPTNNVSWYEAAQFVNYLNTSTGHMAAYKFTGTQGHSDYALSVWQSSDIGYNANNPYRNSNAYYFLPTEDEWVKAAYWNSINSTLQTYSNVSVGDLVEGSPDRRKWNYYSDGVMEPWDAVNGVAELNGTHNMMGNVWEWMENPWTSGYYLPNSYHAIRGGSISNNPGYATSYIASSYRNNFVPSFVDSSIGFRVASVPEPATLLMLILSGLMIRKTRIN